MALYETQELANFTAPGLLYCVCFEPNLMLTQQISGSFQP